MKRNTYLKPVPNNLYTLRVGDYLGSSTSKPVTTNEDLYIIEGNHSSNKLNDRRNIMSIEEKIKNDKETNLPAEDTPKHKMRLIVLLSKISAKFKIHFFKRKNVINQISTGNNSVQIGIQNIYVNDRTNRED